MIVRKLMMILIERCSILFSSMRSPPKSPILYFFLLVPPRIVDFRPNPPLYSIRAGSSLTLACRAEGTPVPNIRWRIRDADVNRVDSCK